MKKLIITLLIVNCSLPIVNAQQWQVYTTQNSQLPSNMLGTMVIDTNNIKWIGTNNGLVKIDGNNWTVYDTNNSPMPINSCSVGAYDLFNNIWIRPANHGLAKFDGTNWILYNTTNSGLPTNNVASVSIDKNNIKWIGTTLGLAKFNDTNWVIYNSNNSGLPFNLVTTVAIENNIKWIGTFSSTGGMAKFNDTNWIIYNSSNSGLPSNAINSIKIDTFGNKWICTYSGGLAKFNSITNSWNIYDPSNSGIPSYYIYCIALKNNLKFIGTEGDGMAIFNDTTWQVFNTSNSPLPNNNINDIKIDKFGKAWIATLGGLAVYTPAPNSINNENTNLPNQFQLFQNYPNPFNPSTIIRFQIMKLSDVKISIYDISGKELTVLTNRKMNTGVYSVVFDGSNLPSGIYFYKLQTEKYSETKKMILLK